MKDLNKLIANSLKEVAPVELQFPTIKAKFPIITLTELINQSKVILEGFDRLSTVAFQVDVWDNGKTRQKCEALAIRVNEIMVAMGFSRVFGQAMNDPSGLQRKTLRYSADLDERTMILYR